MSGLDSPLGCKEGNPTVPVFDGTIDPSAERALVVLKHQRHELNIKLKRQHQPLAPGVQFKPQPSKEGTSKGLDGSAKAQAANDLARAALEVSPARVHDEVLNKSSFLLQMKKELGTAAQTDAAAGKRRPASAMSNRTQQLSTDAHVGAVATSVWAETLGLSATLPSSAVGGANEPIQMILMRQVEQQIRQAARERHQRRLAKKQVMSPGASATLTSSEDPVEEEREDARDRLRIHAQALHTLAEKLQANLGPLMGFISHDMEEAHRHYCELMDQLRRISDYRDEFEVSYQRKVNDLKQTVLRELKNLSSATLSKEASAQQLQKLATELEQKLLDAKVQNDAQAKHIHEQSILVKELSREINIKRSMLKEVQKKTNEVITENRYLRKICAHNDDLLKEIELRKETSALQQEGYEAVQKQLRAEVRHLSESLAQRDQYQDQLKASTVAQQEEVALLKLAQSELENMLAKTRQERDTLRGSCTPRPDTQEMVHFLRGQPDDHLERVLREASQSKTSASAILGTAFSTSGGKKEAAKGADKRVSTSAVIRAMYEQAQEFERELKLIKLKIQLQNKVSDFLADDDLEKLSKTGLTKAKSNCEPGLGTHDGVPMHLRWAGPVVVRIMPINELMATIQYIMEERQAEAAGVGGDSQRTLSFRGLKANASQQSGAGGGGSSAPIIKEWPEFLHAFFQSRFGFGYPAVEAAMSFEHSLDVHSWSIQVQVMRQVLRDEVPEQLFKSALQFVSGAFAGLRALLPPKTAATDRKKKRFVKRKALFDFLAKYAPWLTEGDLTRLRAVMYEEVLSRLGDAVAKGMKEDVPLEILLETPDVDEDTGMLFSSGQNGEVPVSQLSPMATALFRIFIFDYHSSLGDLTNELIKQYKTQTGVLDRLASSVRGGSAANLNRDNPLGQGEPVETGNDRPLTRSNTGVGFPRSASAVLAAKSGVPSVRCTAVTIDEPFLLHAIDASGIPRTKAQIDDLLRYVFKSPLCIAARRDADDMGSEGPVITLQSFLQLLKRYYFGRAGINSPPEKRREGAPTAGGGAPAGATAVPMDASRMNDASAKSLAILRSKRPKVVEIAT
jgi:hypothetical protein